MRRLAIDGSWRRVLRASMRLIVTNAIGRDVQRAHAGEGFLEVHHEADALSSGGADAGIAPTSTNGRSCLASWSHDGPCGRF